LYPFRAASLETLATVDAAGFLHGDIHPENLLVSEQRLTLIDFAYATRSNDQGAMRNEREGLSRIIGVGNSETALGSSYPHRSRTLSAGSRSMTADYCDSYAHSHTSTNSSNTTGSSTLVSCQL
jgi:serine/threonine protein kinase